MYELIPMLMPVFNFLRRVILFVGGMLALGIFLLTLFVIWLNITSWIWATYGDDTFQYWLIGTAIVVALVLVITW